MAVEQVVADGLDLDRGAVPLVYSFVEQDSVEAADVHRVLAFSELFGVVLEDEDVKHVLVNGWVLEHTALLRELLLWHEYQLLLRVLVE